MTLDLFSVGVPPCGSCRHMDGQAINPHIHYCNALKLWVRDDEPSPDCHAPFGRRSVALFEVAA